MNKMIFPIISERDKELPYYLVGYGSDWNQEHIIRPEGSPVHQWIQCVRGEGILLIDGKSYKVGENSAMLLLPGVSHEYYALRDEWIVEWVSFSGSQVESFFKHIAGIEYSGIFYITRPDILRSRLQALMSIEHSERTFKSLIWSGVIYSLLTDIVQYASENPNSSSSNQYQKLRPLFDYIDMNFNKPLTLGTMADIMEVTPQHLCTYFKK